MSNHRDTSDQTTRRRTPRPARLVARMTNQLAALRRDRRGSVGMQMTFGTVLILGLGALTVDVGRMVTMKHQMQAAADAIALSASTKLDRSPNAIVEATKAANAAAVKKVTGTDEGTGAALISYALTFLDADGNVTTDGRSAVRVEVEIQPRKIDMLFGPMIDMMGGKTAESWTRPAVSAAGENAPVICNAPPLALCDFKAATLTGAAKGWAGDITDPQNIGKQVALRIYDGTFDLSTAKGVLVPLRTLDSTEPDVRSGPEDIRHYIARTRLMMENYEASQTCQYIDGSSYNMPDGLHPAPAVTSTGTAPSGQPAPLDMARRVYQGFLVRFGVNYPGGNYDWKRTYQYVGHWSVPPGEQVSDGAYKYPVAMPPTADGGTQTQKYQGGNGNFPAENVVNYPRDPDLPSRNVTWPAISAPDWNPPVLLPTVVENLETTTPGTASVLGRGDWPRETYWNDLHGVPTANIPFSIKSRWQTHLWEIAATFAIKDKEVVYPVQASTPPSGFTIAPKAPGDRKVPKRGEEDFAYMIAGVDTTTWEPATFAIDQRYWGEVPYFDGQPDANNGALLEYPSNEKDNFASGVRLRLEEKRRMIHVPVVDCSQTAPWKTDARWVNLFITEWPVATDTNPVQYWLVTEVAGPVNPQYNPYEYRALPRLTQ